MNQNMSKESKLLRYKPREAVNDTEELLRDAFESLNDKLRPPFSLQIPNEEEYVRLNEAILYGVLTEPRLGMTHFKHLCGIVRDGYECFVGLVVRLVDEVYEKMVDDVKGQLMWVVRMMMHVEAEGVGRLLVSVMRQIRGWDFGDLNLWVCGELIRIVKDYWDWVVDEPVVFTSFVYTYLRLLADHCNLSGHPRYEGLRKMEIDFCVKALRMHFGLCLGIGRDLLRLLQDLVHIEEFRLVWTDLLRNPGGFNVLVFTDISLLYCLRTPNLYFLLRITPEMETKLRFLLTNVSWGSVNRYQEWFHRKYLCGVGCDSVISDVVRFICCAHHPSNDIIQSDIVPRWVIIGWLLQCCNNTKADSRIKFALFFDYLFFDERVDNVMNIEPGMLLMVNSIPKHVNMTHNLLEFLLLKVENYDAERKDILLRGVSTAFSVLVRKKVIHSLEVFTSCSLLSPFIKARLSKIFLSSRSKGSKEIQVAQPRQCSLPPVKIDKASASCKMQVVDYK